MKNTKPNIINLNTVSTHIFNNLKERGNIRTHRAYMLFSI